MCPDESDVSQVSKLVLSVTPAPLSACVCCAVFQTIYPKRGANTRVWKRRWTTTCWRSSRCETALRTSLRYISHQRRLPLITTTMLLLLSRQPVLPDWNVDLTLLGLLSAFELCPIASLLPGTYRVCHVRFTSPRCDLLSYYNRFNTTVISATSTSIRYGILLPGVHALVIWYAVVIMDLIFCLYILQIMQMVFIFMLIAPSSVGFFGI